MPFFRCNRGSEFVAKPAVFSNLTFWVFILGLSGYLAAKLFATPDWVSMAEPPAFYQLMLMIKQLFVQLLRMLIAPVVFLSIVSGMLGLTDVTRLKHLGSMTLIYYCLTTAIAIAIGLTVVFFIHPWEQQGMIEQGSQLLAGAPVVDGEQLIDPAQSGWVAMLQTLLASAFINPFTALAQTKILALVFNAFLIGLAIALTAPADSPLVVAIKQLNQAVGKMLSWLLWLLPVGVFAILFDVTLKTAGGVVGQLFSFALVVFGATLIHAVVVLPLLAWLFAGEKPVSLLRKIASPLVLAFSTSSSAATLPVSMKTAELNLSVSEPVRSFVLPLGATMNMDGTALFEGIAAVFLAYLFGIELSSVAVVMVFLMAMFSSIGAPGMPSGSMAGMQMVMLAVGIPLEAIALLLVIERPLDTFRTAVNVEGDLVGALVVDRWFGSHLNRD